MWGLDFLLTCRGDFEIVKITFVLGSKSLLNLSYERDGTLFEWRVNKMKKIESLVFARTSITPKVCSFLIQTEFVTSDGISCCWFGWLELVDLFLIKNV